MKLFGTLALLLAAILMAGCNGEADDTTTPPANNTTEAGK
jgi:hypothetical protein